MIGESRAPHPRSAPDRIVSIDLVTCALPIEREVRIGTAVYHEREYMAVRLRTADSTEGHAIGYTRGLPLEAAMQSVLDDVLGCRVSRRAAIMTRLQAGRPEAGPAVCRAVSLLEICLWDALARSVSLPLWRLLGGARHRVPLVAVVGYDASERGARGAAAEAARRVDAGFRYLKSHTADATIVAAIRAAVPDIPLGVDVGMAWRSLGEALEACRRLDDLGLAFIEDPFPPERWRLTRDLAQRVRTPLAAGEDAAGRDALLDLATFVPVLRIDATVSGGIAAVLEAAIMASLRGGAVMTHAFPDFHGHLAGAPSVGMVEMIPDDSGVNPVGRLLDRRQRIEGGELLLSEEPGHGAPLDWDAVERVARSSQRSLSGPAAQDEEVRGCD